MKSANANLKKVNTNVIQKVKTLPVKNKYQNVASVFLIFIEHHVASVFLIFIEHHVAAVFLIFIKHHVAAVFLICIEHMLQARKRDLDSTNFT